MIVIYTRIDAICLYALIRISELILLFRVIKITVLNANESFKHGWLHCSLTGSESDSVAPLHAACCISVRLIENSPYD